MKKLPLAFLLVVLAGFCFGLLQLFKLRFAAGDIYPEYSSLRADPLGTKGFYESLDNLLTAGRNYRPFSKLGQGRDTTLFYLGAQSTFMFETRSDLRLSREAFETLESFVMDGGRLVISFFPSFQKPSTNRFGSRLIPNTPPAGGGRVNRPAKKGRPVEDDEFGDFESVSIQQRWGLEYGHDPLLKDDDNAHKADPAAKMIVSKDLPEFFPSHTALFFDKLTNSWRVVYARKKTRPVIIERKLGAGSIVLSADSYLFSNEALSKERAPELLAWMVGPSQHALFDETHLGVEESSGISALARKYRLHGLFAGLLLLAGLFIWKNSTSFMPPYQPEDRGEQGKWVQGKDSATGFVNLLRRNLPARELLAICLTEWKKSCAREQSKAKLQQMQAVIDLENARGPGERNAVETYRTLARIVSNK